ncbi:protein of unknown function [Hyphomicrobium sp. 1Nfss2.1]|uniref:hypothetical protein n=1 Tax=Hyphomicrobium sp. 1Nfss2.1 TaxID=3413936 RepID=UPI003C7D5D97
MTDNQISLSIDGGGFSAAMLVTQETANQSASISTKGVGFDAVSESLTRKGGERDYGTMDDAGRAEK